MRSHGWLPPIIFACLLTCGCARAADSKVDEQKLKSWVSELASQDFDVRERAELSLTGLEIDVVEQLNKALAAQTDEEVVARLKRVIFRLSHPRWLHELNAAKAEAQKTGRPILIFSTIGESDGFA